ncbi:MAG TPA: hypothetical protein VM389_09660 [Phycisphaerae bacterium]|nr:hypothetical protein [Phycisphaerae bacterium]
MRALQVTGPGKCRIIEIGPPRCGADEVLIQVKDWEVELRQRAREVALMKELGLSHGAPATSGSPEPREDMHNNPPQTSDDAG